MSYKVAVFDMDGTILNTLNDLHTATNFALQKNNLPLRTLDEVRRFVGNGILKLIERAVPAHTPADLIQKVYSDFNDYYKIHNADTTAPYPGIVDVICALRANGIKTAVVSNKADYGVQALVADFFAGLFDVAIGEQPGLAKKPAPDMVEKALLALGVQKSDAVYIGDSDVDFATAANSGLDFIGCAWGFKGHDFLAQLGTKNIADTADQLLSFVL